MHIARSPRRLGVLLLLLAVLPLAGCVDRLLHVPAGPPPLEVLLDMVAAEEVAIGARAAYDKAAALRVRLYRGPDAVYSETFPFTPASENRQQVEFEPSRSEETLRLVVELLRQSDVLFTAERTVALRQGATETVELSLMPVAASLFASGPVTLAVGETASLGGAALFATGDTIDGSLDWSTVDPAVVSVDGAGLVMALASGTARIVGARGGMSDTIHVMVCGYAECVPGTALAAGFEQTCMITRTGEPYCWGTNPEGRLGTGHNDLLLPEPRRVQGGHRLEVISGTDGRVCGLDPEGRAWCWGTNPQGQVGDGTTELATAPTAVLGGHRFRQISAGFGHACGRTDDGGLYCWGRNDHGQLGAPSAEQCGNFACSTTPVRVATSVRFTSVSAGLLHTCAIAENERAYCWGWNAFQQLGDGGSTSRMEPRPVAGDLRFSSLHGGAVTSCGITADGPTYCWGYGEIGQMGTGQAVSSPTPQQVAGGHAFVDLALNGENYIGGHICGRTAAGDTYCWGGNYGGQLGVSGLPWCGNASYRAECATSPVRVPGATGFRALSAGHRHTCGIDASGAAHCWGDRTVGQLGDGTVGWHPVPERVATSSSLQAVQPGSDWSTCGLTEAGVALCWGWNTFGQLARPQSLPVATPAPVAGVPELEEVAAGGHHACGLTSDGRVYCWGRNEFGQLGDGTTSGFRPAPQLVQTASRFVSLALGIRYSCGLTADGEVYCWGAMNAMNLSAVPTLVPSPALFTEIRGGWDYACMLTAAGEAYCMGHGVAGQLGDGRSQNSSQPVAVHGGHRFISISPGLSHTCAVAEGGAGYCWGANPLGQLGDGTTTWRAIPVTVAGGLAFEEITAGRNFSCGLSGGVPYCWGHGGEGNVGDGTWQGRHSPVPVATAQRFTRIHAGYTAVCGLNAQGEAYCWGRKGVAGTGHEPLAFSPVRVHGGLVAPAPGAVGVRHPTGIRSSGARLPRLPWSPATRAPTTPVPAAPCILGGDDCPSARDRSD